MLRAVVLALGVILSASGALLCLVNRNSSGIPPLLAGLLVIVGTTFERWRYRHLNSRPPIGSQWQRTGERFVDPETGADMEVYYDGVSGERRYVKLRN